MIRRRRRSEAPLDEEVEAVLSTIKDNAAQMREDAENATEVSDRMRRIAKETEELVSRLLGEG